MGLASDLSQAFGAKPDIQAMRAQVAFTPEEQAQTEANLRGPDEKTEIERELARKDLSPKARSVLQDHYDNTFGGQSGLASELTKAFSQPAEQPAAQPAPNAEPSAAELVTASQPARVTNPKGVAGRAPIRAANPVYTASADEAAHGVGGAVTDVATLFGAPVQVAAAAGTLANLGTSIVMGPAGKPKAAAKGAAKGINTLLGKAEAAADIGGSVGARGMTNAELAHAAVQDTAPEFKAEVEKVVKNLKPGQDIDIKALERHVDAQTLPQPVHLTQGQAKQDVALLSEEMNKRGMNQAQYAKIFDQQNKDLIENARLIREQAAPDVFTVNKAQHGDTIIDAYKAKDASLNADISAKYKALEDANGGQFPMDVKAFVGDATQELQKKLLTDHVPSQIKSTIARLQKDGMTFENFEALRTNLARIQRSATDGNERAAAGVIRDALEKMPLPEQTVGSSLEGSATVGGNLKQLADEARAAAKARFDLLKSDPAYKAVVEGRTKDNFIDKYVVNADRKDVEAMLRNLDEHSLQTARAGAIDTLREAAGIRGEGASNFSQAGYNKALEKLGPKLEILFDPATRKQLQALGNTAKVTQLQPRGSFINNSNTLTGALAEIGKSSMEGTANVAAGGVPIGTWFRKAAQIRAERNALNETMKPGAGILIRKAR